MEQTVQILGYMERNDRFSSEIYGATKASIIQIDKVSRCYVRKKKCIY